MPLEKEKPNSKARLERKEKETKILEVLKSKDLTKYFFICIVASRKNVLTLKEIKCFKSEKNVLAKLKEIQNSLGKEKFNQIKEIALKIRERLMQKDKTKKEVILKKSNSTDQSKFGEIAIEFKYITRKQLQKALEEQARMRREGHKEEKTKIATILAKTADLTREEALRILKEQSKRKKQNFHSERLIKFITSDLIRLTLNLETSNDGMEARVRIIEMPPQIKVPDFKESLRDSSIAFGFVPDKEIEAFLQGQNTGKDFVIACGKKPEITKEAKIFSRFADFFSYGIVKKNPDRSEEGLKPDLTKKIDLYDTKDRPIVKKGEIVAEYHPSKIAKKGKNIYGEEIDVSQIEDPFIAGKNTYLEKDPKTGIQYIKSSITGMPEKKDNVFSVTNTIKIKGDLKSQSVKFADLEGCSLEVEGRIFGIKVRCKNLKAQEIENSEINAQGDVNVEGSIINSKIAVKNSVHANLIRNGSQITGAKKVETEKDVENSTLSCQKAKIGMNLLVGSTIRASERIKVLGNVGTDKVNNCKLILHDPKLLESLQTIKKCNKSIFQLKVLLKNLEAKLKKQKKKKIPTQQTEKDQSKAKKNLEKKLTLKEEAIKYIQGIKEKRKSKAVIECNGIIFADTELISEDNYIYDNKGEIISQAEPTKLREKTASKPRFYNKLHFNEKKVSLSSKIEEKKRS